MFSAYDGLHHPAERPHQSSRALRIRSPTKLTRCLSKNRQPSSASALRASLRALPLHPPTPRRRCQLATRRSNISRSRFQRRRPTRVASPGRIYHEEVEAVRTVLNKASAVVGEGRVHAARGGDAAAVRVNPAPQPLPEALAAARRADEHLLCRRLRQHPPDGPRRHRACGARGGAWPARRG